MNKTVIALCLILSISFANADGFLKGKKEAKKETIVSQLQDMEKHEFGKKILDTITLQLKNNSPMSDIARMLAEIRQDLTLQNHEADNLHAAQVVQCETQITEFNRRIDVATVQREDAESEISLLEVEIATLRADIANKAKQLEILDNREASLREEREADAFAFAARTAQTEEVIGALDMILERLGGISPDASNAAVLAQLAKIGSSNPILALAQVASGFSAASLEKVTGVLENLKDDLEESLATDAADEEAAIAEYEEILGEIIATRNNIAHAKSESESALAQNEGALALQQNILAEAVSELTSAQAGLAKKTAFCEDETATWERNRDARNNELALIARVNEIVATKLDTARVYLQERQN
jgi:chromosome segregation ATPase